MPRLTASAVEGDVRGVIGNVFRIASTEFALFKEEISENLSRAGLALALLLVGAVLGMLALVAFAWAAAAGLVLAGLPIWLAALAVGGAFALIATAMVAWSVANLNAKRLAPTRAMKNVQRDLHVLKEAFDG